MFLIGRPIAFAWWPSCGSSPNKPTHAWWFDEARKSIDEPSWFSDFNGVPMNDETAKRMAVLCVRNTSIEDIHAGIEPYSPSGDFSDVKVVTPAGVIPWPKVSRIRDDEMRAFMTQVVDRLYTIFLRSDDAEFVARIDNYARRMTRAWDAPKDLPDWFIWNRSQKLKPHLATGGTEWPAQLVWQRRPTEQAAIRAGRDRDISQSHTAELRAKPVSLHR
jgi:hypothetical protein